MPGLARSTVVGVVLGLLALGCGDGSRTNPVTTQQGRTTRATEADTSASQTTLALNITVFVPCAFGGAGDTVTLSGDLHYRFHMTSDGNGGIHTEMHINPQGVVGVGSSGDTYRGTGVTRTHVNAAVDGFPRTFTFVNNFRIIGQGSGNNLMVHQVTHLTVNANGDLTASVETTDIDCQ